MTWCVMRVTCLSLVALQVHLGDVGDGLWVMVVVVIVVVEVRGSKLRGFMVFILREVSFNLILAYLVAL